MDDNKFDDIIKNKLAGYEERGFDPASLASLHHQMAAQPVVPWHNRFHHELITWMAIAISTLLVLGIQRYWNEKHLHTVLQEIKTLKASRQKVDALIDTLNKRSNPQADTVRIIEYRLEFSEAYKSLLLRYQALEIEIEKIRNQQAGLSPGINDFQFSEAPYPIAKSRPLLEHEQINSYSDYIAGRSVNSNAGIRPSHSSNVTSPNLSPKLIREMERHYQDGIGVRLGPAIEISKGTYSTGKGQFSLAFGVLTEFIFSPSLSLETGATYSKRNFGIEDKEKLVDTGWPGINERAGELQKVEVDSWILEMPVNIKYRYPASVRTHWIAGIGYSPHVYLRQNFEYNYEYFDGSGPTGFMTETVYSNRSIKVYPGTFNFFIGLNHRLKNNKSIETSIIYQHGLSKMGIEKSNMSLLGLKGIYWFTLR